MKKFKNIFILAFVLLVSATLQAWPVKRGIEESDQQQAAKKLLGPDNEISGNQISDLSSSSDQGNREDLDDLEPVSANDLLEIEQTKNESNKSDHIAKAQEEERISLLAIRNANDQLAKLQQEKIKQSATLLKLNKELINIHNDILSLVKCLLKVEQGKEKMRNLDQRGIYDELLIPSLMIAIDCLKGSAVSLLAGKKELSKAQRQSGKNITQIVKIEEENLRCFVRHLPNIPIDKGSFDRGYSFSVQIEAEKLNQSKQEKLEANVDKTIQELTWNFNCSYEENRGMVPVQQNEKNSG